MNTILISGSNSGIGLQSCQLFLSKGHHVLGIDLAEKAHNGLDHPNFSYKTCDVSNLLQVKDLFSALDAQNVSLKAIVNNAGILGPTCRTADYPEDAFDKILDVNVKGVFYMCKYALPLLLKTPKANIVNVSSVAGIVGMASHIAYCASKHAVAGMSKTMAVEYARTGLRVNAVCPGFVVTPMVETAADQKYQEGMLYATPLKRLGNPIEVAEAIYFLASDEASFITGTCLTIDGGLAAQ